MLKPDFRTRDKLIERSLNTGRVLQAGRGLCETVFVENGSGSYRFQFRPVHTGVQFQFIPVHWKFTNTKRNNPRMCSQNGIIIEIVAITSLGVYF